MYDHSDVWLEIDGDQTYILAESRAARQMLGDFRIRIDPKKTAEWQSYLTKKGMRVIEVNGRIQYIKDVPQLITDVPL